MDKERDHKMGEFSFAKSKINKGRKHQDTWQIKILKESAGCMLKR
jgi:hypothetical protein